MYASSKIQGGVAYGGHQPPKIHSNRYGLLYGATYIVDVSAKLSGIIRVDLRYLENLLPDRDGHFVGFDGQRPKMTRRNSRRK